MAQYLVTLVHGTFARHARWTNEGSPLRKAFTDALGDVTFASIPWSGWNTASARAEAAQRLHEHVRTSTTTERRHYLVGHSHGGNIALQVAGHPDLRDRIAGVICMNTPFFAVFKRNSTQLLLAFFPLVAVLVLYIVAGLNVLGPLDASTAHWPRFLRGILTLIAVTAFGFALSFSIVAAWVLAQKITAWTATQRRLFTSRIGLPDNPRVPVLCVWAAGDEVLSWFQLLDTIAELPHLFLAPLALIAIFAVCFGLHLAGTVHVVLPGYTHLAQDPILWSNTMATTNELEEQRRTFLGICLLAALLDTTIVAIAFTLIGLLLSIPCRLLSMGIPARNLALNALVRIAFTPVPINSQHVEFYDLEANSGLLSHSKAYNDTTALEKITMWITHRHDNE